MTRNPVGVARFDSVPGSRVATYRRDTMTRFSELKDRFAEYWPHDDSPGYSDYPETDIKAHRRNAVVLRLSGLIGFLTGLGLTGTGRGEEYILYGLIIALLCLWAASNLRLQALEWEVKLLKDRGE